MRTVNIAELKNKLSAYITYAKAGETVIIRDRNTSVARLIPFRDEALSDEEQELVTSGLMTLKKHPLDLKKLRRTPKTALKTNAAVQAIIDERNEGY